MATHLEEYLADPENRPGFYQEALILEIGTLLYRRMSELNWTQGKLAERMGADQGTVSKMFSGESMSLRKASDAATAMGVKLTVSLTPLKEQPHGKQD